MNEQQKIEGFLLGIKLVFFLIGGLLGRLYGDDIAMELRYLRQNHEEDNLRRDVLVAIWISLGSVVLGIIFRPFLFLAAGFYLVGIIVFLYKFAQYRNPIDY